jgi:hypothetical protein
VCVFDFILLDIFEIPVLRLCKEVLERVILLMRKPWICDSLNRMVFIFGVKSVSAHKLVIDESVLGFDLVELADDAIEIHLKRDKGMYWLIINFTAIEFSKYPK